MSRIWATIRSLFPFTREGRHTLLYITISLCAPALTIFSMWAMSVVERFPGVPAQERLDAYVKLATLIAVDLLIMVVALACFVSIRSLKIGANGLEADGKGGGD